MRLLSICATGEQKGLTACHCLRCAPRCFKVHSPDRGAASASASLKSAIQGLMRDLTLVFDLDGTLVDTAPDLVAATNHVLDHLGLPRVDEISLRPYVGHGAKHMMVRAIGPDAETMSEAQHEALLKRYLDFYGDHIADRSRPFDGIVPLLEKFK